MNPNTKITPEQIIQPSVSEVPVAAAPTLPVVDTTGGYESLDGPEPITAQVSPASNDALRQMIQQNPTYSEQAVSLSAQPVPAEGIPASRPGSGLGKMIKRFALAAVGVVLLAGGGVFIAASRGVVDRSTVEETPEQLVDIQGESAFTTLKVLDSVEGPRLVINGDLLTTGSLYFGSEGFAGEFSTTKLSSNQSYLLPDSSGEVCLDSNNCNFASPEDVQAATAIQGGAGIVYSGRTIVNTGLLSLNSASGDVTIQGTTNQITVNRSGRTITFSLPQDLNLTSSPSFAGITVANGTIGTLAITSGTQNGNQICDSSNNCGYAGGANAFIDGGNSFGTQAILGTNDTNSLSFETDGVTRLTIDTVGDATFTGSVAAVDFSGDGSNLTNLNASNIASGTLDDARLTSNVAMRNAANTFTTGNQLIQTGAAGNVGLTVQAFAGQTANLQEWQNSSGSVLQYVAANGGTVYNRSTASTGTAMSIYDTGIGAYPVTLTTSTGYSGGLHSSLTLSGSGASANGGVLTVRSAGDSVFAFDAVNRVAVFNSAVSTRIEPYASNGTGLIIQGKASQTGNLQVWRNSSATVLASISASGVGSFANVLQNGNQVCDNTNNCSYAPSSGSGSYIQNGTAMQPNANIAIQSVGATSVGAIIRGAVGQTANFQEWQSSGGSVVARIAANGYIYASGLVSTSAPASSGFVRLSNTETIAWRNAANSADYTLGLNSSDQLVSTAPLWVDSNGTILYGRGGSGQARTALVYNSGNEYLGLWSNGTEKVRLTSAYGVQFGAYSLSGGTNEKLSVNRPVTIDNLANTIITAAASTSKPLVVQGAVSQTANLQEWQDSTGALLTSVSPSGAISFGTASDTVINRFSTGVLRLSNAVDANGSAGGALQIGGYYNSGANYRSGLVLSSGSFGNFAGSIQFLWQGSNSSTLSANEDTVAALKLNTRFAINTSGTVDTNTKLTVNSPTTQDATVLIGASTAGSKGLVIQGAASQTANLQEWQSSTGSVLTYIDASGFLNSPRFKEGASGVVIGGASTPLAGTNVLVESTGGSNKALVVKGASGQTGNLQEWQNSAGTSMSYVNASGAFFIGSASTSQGSAMLQVRNNTYGDIASFLGNSGTVKIIGGSKIELGSAVAYVDYSELALTHNSGNIVIRNSYNGPNSGVTIRANGTGVGTNADIVFQTQNGAVETMRIKGSGNVGIGEVSPSAKLQVTNTSAATVAAIIKGASAQSANLQEWQSSTGTVLASVSSAGAGSFVSLTQNGNNVCDISNNCSYAASSGSSSYIQNGTAIQTNANLAIQSSAAGSVGAVIRGAAAQTANLQEWQSSTGSVLTYIDASGFLNSPRFKEGASGVVIGGASTPLAGTNVLVESTGGSNKALVVKGASGQTANLQEWQNSSGTTIASMSVGGDLNLLGGRALYSYGTGDPTTADARWGNFYNNGAATRFLTSGKGAYASAVPDMYFDTYNGTTLTNMMMLQSSTGNLGIGTTTIGTNNRLIVNPYSTVDNLATAQVNTNAATNKGLVVQGFASQSANLQEWQNSSGTALARVNAGGQLTATGLVSTQSGSTRDLYFNRSDTGVVKIQSSWGSATAYGVQIQPSSGSITSYASGYGVMIGNVYSSSVTSGNYDILRVYENAFSPASGSSQLSGININPIINQTGTATGITRGLYVNPTLTSAVDFRGVEIANASGYGLYQSGASAVNYLAGVTKIGSNGTAGTVEKFRVNTPTTIDNTAATLLATGGAANKGLVVQGAAGQTANLQEWQNSSGTALQGIGAGGELTKAVKIGSADNAITTNALMSYYSTSGTPYITFASSAANSALYVNNNIDSGWKGLVVRGHSAQTANLQEWQDSAGNVLARVNNLGDILAQRLLTDVWRATDGNTLFNRTSGTLTFGNAASGQQLLVTQTVASTTPLAVRAHASTSSNLQEWQNSSGTVLSSVSSSGAIYAGTSYSFTGDTDTSIYRNGIDQIRMNFGGLDRIQMDNNSVLINNKLAVANSISAGGPTFGTAEKFRVNAPTTIDNSASSILSSSASTDKALVLQGAASQTANIFEVQASNGGVYTSVSAAGLLTSTNITATNTLSLGGGSASTSGAIRLVNTQAINWRNAANGANVYGIAVTSSDVVQLAAPVTTNDSAASVSIGTTAAAKKGLVIQGSAAQTASLQEWQNSSGTVLGSVKSDGSLVVGSGEKYLSAASLTVRGTGVLQTAFINTTGSSSTGGSGIIGIQDDGAATSSGDRLGYILLGGAYDASNNAYHSAGITAFASQDFATGSGGSELRFEVMANGSATRTLRVAIPQGLDGFTFGASQDTNLYRNGTGVLKTNGTLQVGGNISFDPSSASSFNGTSVSGVVQVTSATATAKGLVVKGAASQSANLQEWQNSSGTALLSVNSSGAVAGSGGILTVNGFVSSTSGFMSSGSTRVGTITGSLPGMLHVSTNTSAETGIVVRGVTSQTANLQEWQNSSGTALLSVGSTGVINSSATGTEHDLGVNLGIRVGTFLRFGGGSGGASSGVIRMFNSSAVNWRNAANTGNIGITVNASDTLQLGAAATTPDALSDTTIGTSATTRKGLVIQGLASQTANLQEWQSSTGTVLASISSAGNLTVVNATVNGTLVVNGASTFNGNITVNGQIITGNASGSTTVAVDTAGAGTGASASISGNDTSGVITINTGTGAAAGKLATITFSAAFPSSPNVVITPKAIPGGGAYPQYHYDSATGTFDLSSFNALTDSSTYTFSYFITD